MPWNRSRGRCRATFGAPLVTRVAGIVSLASVVACYGANPSERAAIAERDALRRELAGLGELRGIAARGIRPGAGQAIVVVRDSLVQSILVAALPITVRPGQQLDVTLERARVEFAANVTHVVVEGTVRHGAWPRIAAALTLRGALGEFVVDSSGTLGAKVAVDDVLLGSPRGVPEALGPIALGAMQNLVDRVLPAIEDVLPKVAIPVRLDQAITLPGFSAGGTLTVPAARAPLRVGVERVASWGGQLWVVLGVRAGTFTRVTGTTESAASAPDAAARDSSRSTDAAADTTRGP